MRFKAHSSFLLAERKFRLVALHQSLNVRVMFVNNQQRGGQRAEGDRVAAARDAAPTKNKSATASRSRRDRAERNIAPINHHEHKKNGRAEKRRRAQREKDAGAVATPLPPLKSSQTGKQWPTRTHKPAIIIHIALSFDERAASNDRNGAFCGVEQQRQNSGKRSGHARDIGCADIAAARLANVADAKELAPAAGRRESSRADMQLPESQISVIGIQLGISALGLRREGK